MCLENTVLYLTNWECNSGSYLILDVLCGATGVPGPQFGRRSSDRKSLWLFYSAVFHYQAAFYPGRYRPPGPRLLKNRTFCSQNYTGCLSLHCRARVTLSNEHWGQLTQLLAHFFRRCNALLHAGPQCEIIWSPKWVGFNLGSLWSDFYSPDWIRTELDGKISVLIGEKNLFLIHNESISRAF